MRYWTENEINYLVNNYGLISNKELGIILNRSAKSVYDKYLLINFKGRAINEKNKLNFNTLKQIALQYKTRGEFQQKNSSAYTTSFRYNILDEICIHMIPQGYSTPQLLLYEILKILIPNDNITYNDRKIIKPYEIDIYYNDYSLGFEYNGKKWHTNNIKDEIKINLCNKNNINLIIINENNRNYVLDIKNQLINNLNKINNITGLNINESEILDIDETNLYELIKFNIININYIDNTINKYTNAHDFKLNEPKLYHFLSKNKLLKNYTSNLKKNRIDWNEDKIIKIVSQYIYYNDFQKNNNGCYLFVCRHNLKHLLDNLIKRKNNKKQ